MPVPVLKASSKHVWSASDNHVISFFFSASRHCSCQWQGWTPTCETPEFRLWPRVLPVAVCSPRLMFTPPSPTRLIHGRYISVYSTATQPHMHVCTHTNIHTHTHKHTHTHTHTHTHIAHTHAYIHSHTHIHSHMLMTLKKPGAWMEDSIQPIRATDRLECNRL